MKTFVYIDHFKGEVQPASWEAIGVAKSFGTAVALVFGEGADEIAKAAFEYGADEVIVVDDSALTDYRAEPYASTLSALASSATPDLILFPTTARTRELAAMSAVDLSTGVLTDVSKFEMNGEQLVATRPIYEGKVLEKTVCSGKPIMATIPARAFPKPERVAGKTGTLTKGEAKTDALTTVLGYAATESAVNIGDAAVIVSGGRGVSNNPSLGLDEAETAKKGFEMLSELATLAWRRSRRIPRGSGRRLHHLRPSSWANRQSCYSRPIYRLRHLWRDPTSGWHEKRKSHRRHQQRRRCARVQTGTLRRGRRPVPDCPCVD